MLLSLRVNFIFICVRVCWYMCVNTCNVHIIWVHVYIILFHFNHYRFVLASLTSVLVLDGSAELE